MLEKEPHSPCHCSFFSTSFFPFWRTLQSSLWLAYHLFTEVGKDWKLLCPSSHPWYCVTSGLGSSLSYFQHYLDACASRPLPLMLNFQLLISSWSHTFSKIQMFPLSLYLLSLPVQNLSLASELPSELPVGWTKQGILVSWKASRVTPYAPKWWW